jgi:outer membrane protein assembly factor BamB
MRHVVVAAVVAALLGTSALPAHGAAGDVAWSSSWTPATRLWVGGITVASGGPVVTVGCFGTDHIGLVLAYERATGASRWSARINGPGAWDCVDTVAVTPDGRTVIAAGTTWYRSETGPLRFAAAIRAYDARTGALRWVQRVCEQCFGLVVRQPVLTPDGRSVFVPMTLSNARAVRVFRFDVITGDRRWKAALQDGLTSFVVTPDGRSVIGTGSADGEGRDLAVEALRVADGGVRWRRTVTSASPTGRDEGTSLAVSADGAQVFVAGRLDADVTSELVVRSFAVTDGAKGWTVEDAIAGTPVIAVSVEGTVVVTSGAEVRGLSPVTGDEGWSTTVDGIRSISAAPDRPEVYGSRSVGDTGATFLFAIDALTGQVLWERIAASNGRALVLGPAPTSGVATATVVDGTTTGRDIQTSLYRG